VFLSHPGEEAFEVPEIRERAARSESLLRDCAATTQPAPAGPSSSSELCFLLGGAFRRDH
jgi:hypothetical protein